MPEEKASEGNLAEEKEEKKEKEKNKGPFQFPQLVRWAAIVAGILVASYFVVEKVVTPMVGSPEKATEREVKSSPTSWREKMGPIYQFEPIIVNLNEEGARRYLKVSLNIELDSSKVIEEIEFLKPRLLDSLITLLSSKALKDIEGAEGKEKLRREIVGELNRHLNTGRVINAYFAEFMIQ